MDDKLPKCGCGAEAWGPTNLGTLIYCRNPGCEVSISGPPGKVRDMWTRAMSSHAPGMEAMREALRQAATWFGEYADKHAIEAKFEKARRNRDRQNACLAALGQEEK